MVVIICFFDKTDSILVELYFVVSIIMIGYMIIIGIFIMYFIIFRSWLLKFIFLFLVSFVGNLLKFFNGIIIF